MEIKKNISTRSILLRKILLLIVVVLFFSNHSIVKTMKSHENRESIPHKQNMLIEMLMGGNFLSKESLL